MPQNGNVDWRRMGWQDHPQSEMGPAPHMESLVLGVVGALPMDELL